jgi:hypothetical protein
MRSKEYVIAIAVLGLITYTMGLSLVTQAYPADQSVKKLSSGGTIQITASEGLGVYSNYQCTMEMTVIDWGTLEPGATQTILVYVKNEGDSPATLSLETSNWIPSDASEYLTLNWNYYNQIINPGSNTQVALTLSVDQSIQGIENFSFDISIIGNN